METLTGFFPHKDYNPKHHAGIEALAGTIPPEGSNPERLELETSVRNDPPKGSNPGKK